MQSIRNVARLNETELEKVIPSNASWHTDYRDTAYIYIGGLPFELSEGDVLTIFSQYGNPVHINLMRDKDTGKSRGFCFLKYEDQRSCDLAVDNLSGASVMGRMLSVDHTRYKLKEGEVETVGEEAVQDDGDETDREGDRRRKRRRTESESDDDRIRPMIKEEIELQKLLQNQDADDPMKQYLIDQKREEVQEALRAVSLRQSKDKNKDKDGESKHKPRHHHRSREGDEDDKRADRRSNGHRRRDRDGGEREHRRSNGHRKSRHDSSNDEDDRDRSHRSKISRRDRSPTPDSGSNHDRQKDRSKRREEPKPLKSNHENRRRRREDSSSGQ